MKQRIQKNLPGFALVLAIGSIAWLVVPYLSFANSIILGLLFGLLVGNLMKLPEGFEPGVKMSSGRGLELSILFLSFSINYRHIGELGFTAFIIIALSVFTLLILTHYLSKRMNSQGHSGILIGFGTAICGSSAIAALSAQMKSSKEDTGMAIAVINLLGSVMMLTLPLLLPLLPINEMKQGILIGGSLHAVGHVAGAGYAMGPAIGEAAITIKLARVALLSPALIFMHFLLRDKSASGEKIAFRLPWYLVAFIAITVLNSFVTFPKGFLEAMKISGEALLTIAMVAIGLKVRIGSLLKSGKRGMLFGLIIFAALIMLLGGMMAVLL